MRIWLDVLFYSVIGSACMVIKDIVGIVLASFSGVQLVHLGWQGWLGIIPIGITGKHVTQHAVKWSHQNIQPESEIPTN